MVRIALIICAIGSCGIFGYTLGVAIVVVDPQHISTRLRPSMTNSMTTPTTEEPPQPSPSLSLEARRLGTKTWSKTPDNWERMTFRELRSYYACNEHAHDQNKALPTLEEWMFLKKQYRELVNTQPLILDSQVSPTEGFSHGTNVNADTPPPYFAGQSKGKGRGLFASRPIKKGELVHDGPRSSVAFPDAMSFRRLIVNLPRTIACDVTEWAWTQKISEDGEMRILLDLNIAALMNSSHDEPNIAPINNTQTKMYATRDIAQGEEILQDYHVYNVDYEAVGLGF